MTEIFVIVRSGFRTLYNTKVVVKLEEPVSALKKIICEKDKEMQESLLEAIYCGKIMKNDDSLSTYSLFQGATVHIYKKVPIEQPPPPKAFTTDDLKKLSFAFRVFHQYSVSLLYKAALEEHTSPKGIDKIILKVPGLANDPVALTLLRHPELLEKPIDTSLKSFSTSHTNLAWAILHLGQAVHHDVKNLRSGNQSVRTIVPNVNNENMDDVNNSSPASELIIQPVSRNTSSGNITAARLLAEIESLINQQRQSSTSDPNTSILLWSLDDD